MEPKTLTPQQLLDVIEALLKEQYTLRKLPTDFSGCYDITILPNGTKEYIPLEDDCRCGTTPPIRKKVIEVCGLTFFCADSGYDYYEPDLFLIDEASNEDYYFESSEGRCNIDIEGVNDVQLSEDIKQLLDSLRVNTNVRFEGDKETGNGYIINSQDLKGIIKAIVRKKICTRNTWYDDPYSEEKYVEEDDEWDDENNEL